MGIDEGDVWNRTEGGGGGTRRRHEMGVRRREGLRSIRSREGHGVAAAGRMPRPSSKGKSQWSKSRSLVSECPSHTKYFHSSNTTNLETIDFIPRIDRCMVSIFSSIMLIHSISGFFSLSLVQKPTNQSTHPKRISHTTDQLFYGFS